jgi:hypothetical protein
MPETNWAEAAYRRCGSPSHFGDCFRVAAYSEEILPLSEQRGATGSDNALTGRWHGGWRCRALPAETNSLLEARERLGLALDSGKPPYRAQSV